MADKNWHLTRWQRTSYSVGMFSTAFVTATVLSWVLYYYSPPPNKVDAGMVFLGAAMAVGIARLFGSLVDALTNPLIAFWSDKSRHPGGRRIPFIRRGVIPLMVFACLIWFPPVYGGSTVNVIWLAITLGATWFFYTYVVAPYLALMPELTPNAEERVSLTVTMAYFESAAGIITTLGIPPVIEAMQKGVSLGPVFVPDGFKATALVLAVIGGLGFWLSIRFVKEKPQAEVAAPTMGLWQSIVECFKNPSFPPYLLAVSSAKVANSLILIALPFVVTAVVHKGEGFIVTFIGPMFLAVIAGFIVAEKWVNRVGLKKAFRHSVLMATVVAFGLLAVWFMDPERKELVHVEQGPSADQVLHFGSAGGPSDMANLPVGMSEKDDTVLIRITHLQWRSLFYDPDLEAFRKFVEPIPEDRAVRCFRTDLPAGTEAVDKTKTWLMEEDDTALLLLHLTPNCGEYLFPAGKKRFADDLYVSNPLLVAGPEPGKKLQLGIEVGTVKEPEEVFNLDGWRIMFAGEEERKRIMKPIPADLSPPLPILFDADIAYLDGSLSFSGFSMNPEASPDFSALMAARPEAATRIKELLADLPELETLLSRFDMRVEYAWSLRIYLVIALFFLLGFPAAVLMSMYRPIVCEIIDMDEQRVGTRREAIYFGVEGLLTKFADGLSAVLAPALMLLGHLFLPPPLGYVLPFAGAGVFMVLAFFFFEKYPLGQRSTPSAPAGGESDVKAAE